MISGAILVRKPAGITSFGVLERLQSLILEKCFAISNSESELAPNPEGKKIRPLPKTKRQLAQDLPLGHAGTLDPFATGLLIVLLGKATKLSQHLLGMDKAYIGTLRWGIQTSTADLTGEVISTQPLRASQEDILSQLKFWKNREYLQTPPMHSAKKVDGVRLYELAREGHDIERASTLQRVISTESCGFPDSDHFSFRIEVSSGTYIRTWAEDFAKSLATTAHLTALERVSIGPWSLEQAISLEAAAELATDAFLGLGQKRSEGSSVGSQGWIPFDDLLVNWVEVSVSAEEARAVLQGKQYLLPKLIHRGAQELEANPETDRMLLRFEGKLFALLKKEAQVWRIERVFPESFSP